MFFVALTILSDFANANLLSSISMNNQERKARLQVVHVIGDELLFFHLVLKQINVVVVVIISTIHMQNLCS